MKTTPWEVDEEIFTDAYVAGFFDGDGSLVAILEKQTSKYKRIYRPRIRINFTQHLRHSKMLEKLRNYLDTGSVLKHSSHNMAELVIQDRIEIYRILKRLLPHLVLKKNQVILALEIISLMGKNTSTNRISEENYNKILNRIKKIRTLNSKSGGKRNIDSFNPVTTSH